ASYNGLAEGLHTFRVRATDSAGNTDPTPAERSWTVQANNAPPVASFTLMCSALTCSFDGSPSADGDGTIQSYSWNFGDGSGGGGKTISHTYARAGGYAVALTVADNAGATDAASKTVSPITLTARGYKVKGLEKVDLYWNGPSGASVDICRDGTTIVTVQAT